MKIILDSPLKIKGYQLFEHNGNTELEVFFYNNTAYSASVVAKIICYDKDNIKIDEFTHPFKYGLLKSTDLKVKIQNPETKRVDILVIYYEDSSLKWQSSTEAIDVEIKKLNSNLQKKLVAIAGDFSTCLYSKSDQYWVCICGYPNKIHTEKCENCRRSKIDLEGKYHSIEKIEEMYNIKIQNSRKKKRIFLIVTASLVAISTLVFLSLMIINNINLEREYKQSYAYYEKNEIAKSMEINNRHLGDKRFKDLQIKADYKVADDYFQNKDYDNAMISARKHSELAEFQSLEQEAAKLGGFVFRDRCYACEGKDLSRWHSAKRNEQHL